MPTTHAFTGNVRLFTDYDLASQPATGALPLQATFDAEGRWRVEPQDFGDGGRFDIPSANVSISLREAAIGRHDSATAEIDVVLSCAFDLPLGDSTLQIQLDPGTYTLDAYSVAGAPLDAGTGRVRLAGAGNFKHGMLNGYRCLVEVDGSFTPNPWA
jgi:hypothetical protein